MWRLFTRSVLTFAFTMFGKRVIALAAAIIFIIATALLADLKLVISATVTGFFAVLAVVIFCVQSIRQVKERKAKLQRQADAEARRAASANSRSEKMERAKTTVADAVKSATTGASGMMYGAKAGLSEVSSRWRK
jgi:predicted membrane protein